MKTLEQVQEYLRSVPFLNYGGCGIAAIAIYRWIKKNNPELIEGIKFCYSYGSHRDIEGEILTHETGEILTAPSHAQLFDGDNYIDSDGHHIFPNDEDLVYLNLEEEVVDSINHGYGWNDMFDRNNVVNIAEKLNINLKDIVL